MGSGQDRGGRTGVVEVDAKVDEEVEEVDDEVEDGVEEEEAAPPRETP